LDRGVSAHRGADRSRDFDRVRHSRFPRAAGGLDEGPEGRAGLRKLAANLGYDGERLERDFAMLRDRTSELIQTYRDNVDTQLNNIMRSLTVLSAIFMPLSFITSFYGMNFTSIPAFSWPGGFPIAVGVMVTIAAGAFTYARRRKWL
jgi:Mg2+ and Co2+ transporter CorA